MLRMTHCLVESWLQVAVFGAQRCLSTCFHLDWRRISQRPETNAGVLLKAPLRSERPLLKRLIQTLGKCSEHLHNELNQLNQLQEREMVLCPMMCVCVCDDMLGVTWDGGGSTICCCPSPASCCVTTATAQNWCVCVCVLASPAALLGCVALCSHIWVLLEPEK